MPGVSDLYSPSDLSRQARLTTARHFDGDAERLRDAMEEYEGTFSTMPAYVRSELAEHLAPYMAWLLDYVEIDRVADDWIKTGRNWILPDTLKKDDRAVVHVFLSSDPHTVATEIEVEID